MKQPDITHARDPDLRSSMVALLRAGILARKVATDTETDLVIVKDGRLVLVEMKKSPQNAPADSAPARWGEA